MHSKTINPPLKKEKIKYNQSLFLEFFILLALLVFSHLLTDNMAENEVGKLMLAKQFISTDWLPNDWYLSQPQSYQAFFQLIFGKSILAWGFLATSIIGRIVYYSLISSSLILIARQIKLQFLPLLIAITLFLYSQQGIVVAGEWMIGSLETKGFSYGLVLIAIWLSMKKRYIWTIASLGLATSLHILVGGYATLTFLMWAGWLGYKNNYFQKYFSKEHFSIIALSLFIYLVTSIFATFTLAHSLSQTVSVPDSELQATYIYTFLRNSHHLNPFVWQKIRFFIVAIYLSCLYWCWKKTKQEVAQDSHLSIQSQSSAVNRLQLLELTCFSLVPFFCGFAIAFFDSQGVFLQYYPFRFGSLMLALNVLLISAYLIQDFFQKSKCFEFLRNKGFLVCLIFLATIHTFTLTTFTKDLVSLSKFPIGVEKNNEKSQDIFDWIQQNTEQDAVIISPPGRYVGFNWLTNRATIAKFKLVPPTETKILEWYARLNDLSGHPPSYIWPEMGFKMAAELDKGYSNLTTSQVIALMEKYDSQYFFDSREHKLNLPIAYENDSYRLYRAES
ncbi:hypothetical protein Lepto7376_1329 [[Leptolyngbya] sp. PCC 7376]|uniref:DUF6798 domain-containing protein n=1 Tax=[Leptolyngbya] sp. PCC 7376 TaxID=111781 RepID=UPI00029EF386|nr:DUF6798 domain-containing protein [[Leptolyngbya] sp. PCC 7376]AFY37681.1 hypothetical protein Lepto7376_1329 [[Leptolyngbya] sp. PCC 7376]